MQDDCHIFGNGKSSKTTKSTSQIPLRLGDPKPEGKDEGESYTLFRTLPMNLWVDATPILAYKDMVNVFLCSLFGHLTFRPKRITRT